MRQDDINYQNAFAGEPAPNPEDGQIMSGPAPNNFDGLSSVPYISNWQNALVTFKHDWLTSSTKKVLDAHRIKMQQEDTTSPVASEQDVQDAIKAVPGLKVPKGVRENTLTSLKSEQVQKNNTEYLLSLSKPGFLNRTAQMGNKLIMSTLTNPVSLGVGAAAGTAVAAAIPEASIPIGAAEIGPLATALGLNLARTSAIGAVNFGVAQLSDEAAEEQYSKATGQDYSAFNGLMNITQQGVIGAAMFGIPKALLEGFRPEVRQLFSAKLKAFGGDQAADAAQAALNQAALHGKDPGEAAAMGYRRGIALSARIFKDRMDQLGVSVEEANEAANTMRVNIDQQHQPIKDEIKRQDDLLKDNNLNLQDIRDAKNKINSLTPLVENAIPDEQLKSLKLERTDLAQKRTLLKKSFEDRNALLKKQKPKLKRKEREQIVEKGLSNDLEPIQKAIDTIDQRLERNSVAEKAKADLTRLEQKIRPFINDATRSKGVSLVDYLEQRQNLENSNLTFEQLKATNALHSHFINTDETEVPNDAFNDFLNNQKDPHNDFKDTGGVPTLDEPGREFKNPKNLLEDTYTDEAKQRILPDESVLSDEEKAEYQQIKNAPKRKELFSRATDNLIRCLLGSEL
jgi:hypothetical protein